MIKNISNLGDAALYCDFGNEVNREINSEVIKYFKTLKNENIDKINNLTPSYNKLIISYDLKKTNFKEIKKIVENLSISEKILVSLIKTLSENKKTIPENPTRTPNTFMKFIFSLSVKRWANKVALNGVLAIKIAARLL